MKSRKALALLLVSTVIAATAWLFLPIETPEDAAFDPTRKASPPSAPVEVAELGDLLDEPEDPEAVSGRRDEPRSGRSAAPIDPRAAPLPIARRHPQLVKNIKARQGSLLHYRAMLQKREPGEGIDLGFAACAASQLSILTIMDATGRSHVVDPDADRSEMSVALRGGLHSGGAVYIIPRGEFPEYDSTQDARDYFRGSIPLEEIPLDRILDRVDDALRYAVD